MARLIYARRALADLKRLSDSLLETDPAAALYDFDAAHDTVLLLAIRYRREAGYAQD